MRAKQEYEAAILEDLAWLGLRWDAPPLRQSTRVSAYRAALDQTQRAALSLFLHAQRNRRGNRTRRRGAARSGRTALSRHLPCAQRGGTQRAHRDGRGLCVAPRCGRGRAANRPTHLPRGRSRPGGEHGEIAVDPLLFGDYRAGAQGNARGLSSCRRRRRCLSGSHARHPRRRSVRGDACPARAAGLAGFARAALRPSPAHSRRAGAKILQARFAVTLRALREDGVTPADIRKQSVVTNR